MSRTTIRDIERKYEANEPLAMLTRFEKQYADLDSVIRNAVEAYVTDVQQQTYPACEHVFEPIDEE